MFSGSGSIENCNYMYNNLFPLIVYVFYIFMCSFIIIIYFSLFKFNNACVCVCVNRKFVCDFHQLIICLSFNEIFCTCPAFPPSPGGPLPFLLCFYLCLTISQSKNTKH